MRTRLLLVLCLLFVTAAAHAQEAELALLEVAGVTLRLRGGPSTDHAILDTLRPGTALELLERGEQWSQVRRQDGLTGWAHNDFLRPFDERNRPDARRRVGERRLFNVFGQHRYADLRVVSDHSYLYTISQNNNLLPDERALQRIGELFDEQVYRQSLELWDIREAPAIEGDERVVILFVTRPGDDDIVLRHGWYAGRHDMPQESNPSGTGFIGIRLTGKEAGAIDIITSSQTGAMLAHEFSHMLHHHVGGNQVRWVNEGLAMFSETYLGLVPDEFTDAVASGFLSDTRTPLDTFEGPFSASYSAGLLFMTYIYERLGLETLRDFVIHPKQGLDALDSLLADREADMDADVFFADWVLANNLLDTQRASGRYGYQRVGKAGLGLPTPRGLIRKFPATFREALLPYATDYFELPQDIDRQGLLLDFRLKAPAFQDAWLQLVQVLPERIDVQRFRASDFRDRPILVSLAEQPERAFLAISPFTPGARQQSGSVTYSLALRDQPPLRLDRAQVTTTLRIRSGPEIADNILGKLQRCSFVQVLEPSEEWSRVLSSDGLTGWSHNDFLAPVNAPEAAASTSVCVALPRAANDGDLAEVQRLLAAGFPVNGADAFGHTALHEAAMWGHDAILTRLLRAGADVHVQDASGLTALDVAIRTGNVSSLLMLHEAGANLDLSGPASLPLMIDAAAQGYTTLLDLILAGKINVNWQDESGRTALAAAAANGRAATLKTLLAAGADVQRLGESGRSPLMLAAANGHVGALAQIHEAGGNFNRQDHKGHTAMTLAAANGHANAVAWLLLNENMDVHQQSLTNGRNALHLAADAGHLEVVALLLLANMDVTEQDDTGLTALQLAAEHNEIVELLRLPGVSDRNAARTRASLSNFTVKDVVTFVKAAGDGNLPEVDRYLRAGLRPDLSVIGEDKAITLAARNGKQAVVLRLLLAGANPDGFAGTFFPEMTPLYQAIQGGHDDISAMLLLAGARTNSSTSRIPSPLHWAARSGRPHVVRLLLNMSGSRRAQVDATGYSNKTPLFEAVIRGDSEIVDLLLEAGADPNASDNTYAVPLNFAIIFERADIVKRLLAAGADPDGDQRNKSSLLDLCRGVVNPTIERMLLAAGAQA